MNQEVCTHSSRIPVKRFTVHPVCAAVRTYIATACGLLMPLVGQAQGLYFDPAALDPRGGHIAGDLEVFSRGQQLPGVYRVDIFLNRTPIANRDVMFAMEQGALQPQLTVNELAEMGVNTSALQSLRELGPDTIIRDIGKHIPEARMHFNFSQERLDVQIPQASLKDEARNAMDPMRWDQGVPALLMSYNLTGAHATHDGSGESDNLFLGLGTGINVGAWRLRNDSTFTYSKNSRKVRVDYSDRSDLFVQYERYDSGQKNWQSINTYLQRDIHSIRGQLTLGEGYTPGTLLGGIQFRGFQLSSDDSMLPDSQRGFAPVVRGIANSGGQLTIRQNGYVIYQNYVAPGPYIIKDFYPGARAGDLEVTLREEDGRERTYIQPYASVPLMQREGRLHYELTAGQFRSQARHAREPLFAQSSFLYGLSNLTTVYGGITASPVYYSAVAGLGQGLGTLGSVSVDVTQANAFLQDKSRHQGQSLRVQYGKDLLATGTNFTLAGYRYSTSGYYDFKDANEFNLVSSDDWLRGYNKRSKMEVQVSQMLGDLGSLNLSAYQQDYWGRSSPERTFGVGYNTSYKGINVGFNVNQTQTRGRGADRQYVLTAQIPLGRLMPDSWLTTTTQAKGNRSVTQSATVSGLALENKNLNYSVRQSLGTRGEGNTGGANLTYKGVYGTTQAGYSYTPNGQQYTGAVQGGMIIHPDGVTLSQPLGDTVVLVEAPNASGVRVKNQSGLRTNSRGHTVVPNATPYQENRVVLASDSFSDDLDVEETVQIVVPTKGAVVKAGFKTRIGSRLLVTLRNGSGFVPFGARATLYDQSGSRGKGNELGSGIVGEKGELYLSGVPDDAHLQIEWGSDGSHQVCNSTLSLSSTSTVGAIKTATATCDPNLLSALGG